MSQNNDSQGDQEISNEDDEDQNDQEALSFEEFKRSLSKSQSSLANSENLKKDKFR